MPTISRSDGTYGQFLIGWAQSVPEHGGDRDLWVRRFSPSLVSSTPAARLTNTPEEDDIWPDIDGDGRQWLVVSEVDPDLFGANTFIRRQRVFSGGSLLDTAESSLEFSEPNVDYSRPQVAYTGISYCVAAFREQAGELDVHVRAWGGTAKGAFQSEEFFYPPLGVYDAISIASRHQATSSPVAPMLGEVQVVFGTNTGIGYSFAVDASVGIEQLYWGCDWDSTTRVSAPGQGNQLLMEYESEVPGTLVLCSLGYTASFFACDGCVLVPNSFGPGSFLWLTTDSNGDASHSVPVQSNPALVGFQAYQQFFSVPTDPVCELFGVDGSRAVEITVF